MKWPGIIINLMILSWNIAKEANIKQGSQFHKLSVLKIHWIYLKFLKEILKFDPAGFREAGVEIFIVWAKELVKRELVNKDTFSF